MADYIELPLVDDPDALLEVGVDYLEAAIVGFVSRPRQRRDGAARGQLADSR
jgi:hypothetical protein